MVSSNLSREDVPVAKMCPVDPSGSSPHFFEAQASDMPWNPARAARFLRGEGAHAVASLQEMLTQQLQVNAFHFNASIAAVGHAQEWQAAIHCLRLMDLNQVKRDTVTYNTCMTICTKVSEFQKSLALYSDMSRVGVSKDRFTYSATIKVCERMNQWPLVICLMQDMQRGNVPRDEVIYNASIASMREKWDAGKNAELFHDFYFF